MSLSIMPKTPILFCVITADHTVKQTLVALYSPQEFNYINDISELEER